MDTASVEVDHAAIDERLRLVAPKGAEARAAQPGTPPGLELHHGLAIELRQGRVALAVGLPPLVIHPLCGSATSWWSSNAGARGAAAGPAAVPGSLATVSATPKASTSHPPRIMNPHVGLLSKVPETV